MKWFWTVVLVAGLMPLAVFGQQKIDQIAARVNQDIILKSEIDREMELRRLELEQQKLDPEAIEKELAEQSKLVLRDLIDRALLLQIAKEANLSADQDVEQTLEDLRVDRKFESREELERAIIKDYGDLDEFKNDLRTKFLTQQVIEHEVYGRMIVTSEEMRKYYDENQKEFDKPAGYGLAEITILVDRRLPDQVAVQRKKIEEALAAVKKGDDFAEVARKYSEVESAQRGGDMGYVPNDQINEEIAKALEKLQRGDVSEILEFNDALTFFKVIDKHAGGILSFDLAQNQIRYALLSKQAPEKVREFLGELRNDGFVDVKPGFEDAGAVPQNKAAEGR